MFFSSTGNRITALCCFEHTCCCDVASSMIGLHALGISSIKGTENRNKTGPYLLAVSPQHPPVTLAQYCSTWEQHTTDPRGSFHTKCSVQHVCVLPHEVADVALACLSGGAETHPCHAEHPDLGSIPAKAAIPTLNLRRCDKGV